MTKTYTPEQLELGVKLLNMLNGVPADKRVDVLKTYEAIAIGVEIAVRAEKTA